ncbi:MAG: hypothetical protein WC310_00050 [Patescibacteria group bacterium]|jgi:hypothetical protein
MKKNLVIFIVIVVIVAAGSFYLGMSYGKKGNGKNFAGPVGEFSRNGIQGTGLEKQNGQGSGFVDGEIIAKDDKSITVKLKNGGSKIVLFSETTTVGKTTDGTVADLEVGKTVMVSGTTGSDGSVAAKSIQIRPDAESQPTAQPINDLPAEQPKQ